MMCLGVVACSCGSLLNILLTISSLILSSLSLFLFLAFPLFSFGCCDFILAVTICGWKVFEDPLLCLKGCLICHILSFSEHTNFVEWSFIVLVLFCSPWLPLSTNFSYSACKTQWSYENSLYHPFLWYHAGFSKMCIASPPPSPLG